MMSSRYQSRDLYGRGLGYRVLIVVYSRPLRYHLLKAGSAIVLSLLRFNGVLAKDLVAPS